MPFIYWYEAIGTINPFKQPELALELKSFNFKKIINCKHFTWSWKFCDSDGKLSIPVVQYLYMHMFHYIKVQNLLSNTYKLLQSLSGYPVEEDKFLQ